MINHAETLTPEFRQPSTEFPKLFTRNGRVKNYEIKIKMQENAKVTQQRGGKIPIQLQDQVDAEIQKLLKDGNIENAEKIQDDVFIQPTVITVKKHKSVKIALDARALNESIAKDMYQMPKLCSLIDMIAENLDEKEGQTWYSSMNLRSAVI